MRETTTIQWGLTKWTMGRLDMKCRVSCAPRAFISNRLLISVLDLSRLVDTFDYHKWPINALADYGQSVVISAAAPGGLLSRKS